MEEQMDMGKKSSPLQAFTPTQMFVGGIVSGVLVLCTIGFFILLSLFMRQGGFGSGQVAYNNDTAQPTQPSAPAAPNAPVNVGVGHFPALGKANAPVTVIEFADFRCPFCERFYNDAAKNIIKDYVSTGKVKFYYRNFAFLGPESTALGEASECANEQGKFWQFHDWLFDNQASESDLAYYSNDNIIKYAVGVGLNKQKFTDCLNSHKYAAQLNQDISDAQAAGVNGTPATFINGVLVSGAQPYSSVKAIIEQALKNAGK